MTTGKFTEQQVAQLLKPINPRRVLQDDQNHSHVSAQDVTAHLIRMFGFGSFDTAILDLRCVFEEKLATYKDRYGKEHDDRWDVCYSCTMRLTVRDPDGNVVTTIEDGSTDLAQKQTRGAGHDLAMKSAISLALKRCAKSLGDQFGLSLYNKGQLKALVIDTMVGAPPKDGDGSESVPDIQEGVEQQVSMGADEADIPMTRNDDQFDDPNDGSMAGQEHEPAVPMATDEQIQNIWRALAVLAVPPDQQLGYVQTAVPSFEGNHPNQMTYQQAEDLIDAMAHDLDVKMGTAAGSTDDQTVGEPHFHGDKTDPNVQASIEWPTAAVAGGA